jgi:hypothetical protein
MIMRMSVAREEGLFRETKGNFIGVKCKRVHTDKIEQSDSGTTTQKEEAPNLRRTTTQDTCNIYSRKRL